MTENPIYGIVAEFADPGLLVAAVAAVHSRGYRKVETYTPYPIHEVEEILEPGPERRLPRLVLAGGILGTLTAWGMQYYIAAIDYPLNIGGRPLNSWPAFIVIMFELTILFASLTAFFGMLGLCGLPLPHHPLFNLRRFALCSKNRFFLCVEAADPLFEVLEVADLLAGLDPLEVSEVYED
ncbi:MAG TPA: DUF3341 domain-containing protein [Candidatus Acidoferrales bacterium]|nr:DUF3341 domain-containing protein [Candidatus Acidoferrales bacterium]